MTAQLLCECGKQLRIAEHHVGRRIQCPVCGKAHLVSSTNITASPLHASSLAGLPAAGALSPQPFTRRKWLLLALLVLAAGAVTGWLLFRKATAKAEGNDLALIPANAQAFGTIRLAALWKTPAMQKALMEGSDFGDKIERTTGLKPEDIERFSGVSMEMEGRLGWVIARTVAPFDVEEVLARLSDRREVFHRGNRYYVGMVPDRKKLALYFAGTRVIVAGSEEGVKRCLDFVKDGPATGPLEPSIALAAKGKHTAVAGVFPPETLALFRVLSGIERITATLDIDENAVLEATAQTASEATARQCLRTLTLLQGLERAARTELLSTILGPHVDSLAEPLNKLLEQAEFTRKGNEIHATVRIEDGGNAAKGVLAIPRFLGP
jgi:hypothetical protein